MVRKSKSLQPFTGIGLRLIEFRPDDPDPGFMDRFKHLSSRTVNSGGRRPIAAECGPCPPLKEPYSAKAQQVPVIAAQGVSHDVFGYEIRIKLAEMVARQEFETSHSSSWLLQSRVPWQGRLSAS